MANWVDAGYAAYMALTVLSEQKSIPKIALKVFKRDQDLTRLKSNLLKTIQAYSRCVADIKNVAAVGAVAESRAAILSSAIETLTTLTSTDIQAIRDKTLTRDDVDAEDAKFGTEVMRKNAHWDSRPQEQQAEREKVEMFSVALSNNRYTLYDNFVAYKAKMDAGYWDAEKLRDILNKDYAIYSWQYSQIKDRMRSRAFSTPFLDMWQITAKDVVDEIALHESETARIQNANITDADSVTVLQESIAVEMRQDRRGIDGRYVVTLGV